MIALGLLDLVEQELHCGQLVHVMEQLAQDPDLAQLLLGNQQLFASRARSVDVDRRIDPLFHHAAVQVQFGVTGALEFFKNHLVHPAAGIDQRGGDDRERAAFFNVARGTEKALWPLQRVGIDAAGEHLA